ncbi:MAG: exosortase H-associated membrane protein [Dokdonella sp.]|uniref:exosortase H-associated membrane protein n=1 Tax=Dokdonella sp. TaxID=2291710 RepID=UPI003F7FCABA
MALSPIREFGLKALLWLPLAFVIWFWAAALWVLPAMLIAKPVLLGHWGDLFESVRLGGELLDGAGRSLGREAYLISLGTRVTVVVQGGAGVLEPTLNPMIYAWSLPLFGGLAMATPLSSGRRLVQFMFALAVIWLAQAFGIVAESLKTLAFDAGASGAAAIARAGLDSNAIALAYQFATLILPAIVPVALWIGLNRAFIETLVGQGREPGRRDGV